MSQRVTELAAMGGKARAKKLSAQQRAEIAREGAMARWSGPRLFARYGDESRPLRIGPIEIPCYVLSDGRRVLSQRGLQGGIGLSRSAGKSGARRIAQLLASLDAKGLDTSELTARVNHPVRFMPPHGGNMADGYEATILPDICEVVVKADQAGKLLPQQRHVADQCRILLHGFANVGIIALVDEATGYQDVRARDALAKILEEFVAKELRKWVRTFPIDYFKELCRLRGIPFPTGAMKLPPYFGHLTNDIVYSRLAPGVLDEIKQRNPVVKTATSTAGYRKNKNFQWLTDDVGAPRLHQHLGNAITLMKACPDGGWEMFKGLIDRALPQYSTLPLIRMIEQAEGMVPDGEA